MLRSVHGGITAAFERIVDAIAKDEAAARACQRLLLPLQREDAERGNNLVTTLRSYYACGLRVDKTAERMFLHRNSVRYRLDRIRALLHLDIDLPAVSGAFVLALAICDHPASGENNRDAV
jgi:DNA-binding PucR family transcriptional regulator